MISSQIPGNTDAGLRGVLEGLIAQAKNLGERWRITEGPFPNPNSAYCLLMQLNVQGSWVTKQAIDANGTLLIQQAWQTPTLLNSWANLLGGNVVAGYYRIASGLVVVKAALKNSVAAPATQMFILPAGYRPLETVQFVAQNYTGSVSQHAVVSVSASGSVDAIVFSQTGGNAGNLVFYFSFRAER